MARRRDIATLIDREVGELDQLMCELRCGIHSARHFDELEARAAAIAARIRAAFRSAHH